MLDQKPTELIYTGNCQKIIEALQKSEKVYIEQKKITIKEGTSAFKSFYDEWRYYPVTFMCTDNIDSPNGNYAAGDFMYSIGYLKKLTF